jgi:hypothetical protein
VGPIHALLGVVVTVNEVHALMLRQCINESLPEHYQDDVYKHDLWSLRESYGDGPDAVCGEFLWLLRTCGSFLRTKAEHHKKPSDTSTYLSSWYGFGGVSERRLWYYFNGKTLRQIEPGYGKSIPAYSWSNY